jgi:hypothetical protein
MNVSVSSPSLLSPLSLSLYLEKRKKTMALGRDV